MVITHGTSTAEETGIFIDLTVNSDKPVVVVGAMRPATAISADGPFNLLQAIAVAAHPSSVGRGTLLVANDRISSAMYTSKTHTQAMDTFQAADQGHLGVVVGTKPYYFYEAAQPRPSTRPSAVADVVGYRSVKLAVPFKVSQR